MEVGMSVLRNLFSHQKHHVQKVCISHVDSGAPVEFHGVVDIDDRNHHQAKGDNNLFVACDKKGKKTKNKFSKKKEKYHANASSTNERFCDSNATNFHRSNSHSESDTVVVEDLDDYQHERLTEHLEKSSLNHNRQHPPITGGVTYNYCYPFLMNNTTTTTTPSCNGRLVGTTHPSYLQTSLRSGKINASCFCSNEVDEHFKPTPIHIFCADSDFGAGVGGESDDDDDDDDYDGDSDFDDGKSKKGKKKVAAKGKSKSDKSSTKSRAKTNTPSVATPGTNRSKSKVSGLKPAKSMPSIARTVSTPPSVPKSSSNVSGLSSVAGRRPSWVSPGLANSNAKSPSLGGVTIKSPLGGGGLRLGLSKKMRVKPLHSSVKLQN